jgi:hypothetical protein
MTNDPQQPEIKPEALQRLDEVPVSDDIVNYTLACVLALAPRTSAAIMATIDRQVRDVFGGDEVWIAEGAAQLRKERDAKIRRDYLAGERLDYLERKYGIGRRRIFQILKS